MSDWAISADSHIVEPKELFDGLERRFGDRAPTVRWDDKRGDVIQAPGVSGAGGLGPSVPVGRLGIAGGNLNDPKIQEQMAAGYAGLPAGVVDPKARAVIQYQDGVAAEVLFPSLYFRVFGIQDAEVLTAAFQSYNDWLWSYAQGAPDRLIPLALIPVQDVDAGVTELKRALQMGYKGICLPCVAPKGRPYSDRSFDPIWALAEEAGVPVNFHIFTGADQTPNDLQLAGPITSYASAATLIQMTTTDLICQGVAHRYPRLKFVLGEWEAGWIAQWLVRLDHAFYRSRASAPTEIDMEPTDYWKRQFYATFEDDRFGVMTRSGIGVENLMWANDYPHHDSIWPHSREVWADIMAGVPESEKRAMLVDNVAKLYKLAVPAEVATT
jgi:predicted TIM-barrel fold metal-dependent hydrolase